MELIEKLKNKGINPIACENYTSNNNIKESMKNNLELMPVAMKY